MSSFVGDVIQAVDKKVSDTSMRVAPAIPYQAKVLLDDLRILQVQIDALPGPRLHQDHDFIGEPAHLDTLYSWLNETAWVPYWGQPPEGECAMLFLGGRDPWIETLEMRLWDCLQKLAKIAGCELVGRGAVAPDDDELELIREILPQVAASQGWIFEGPGERVVQ